MQTFFPVHASALRCDYAALQSALQQGVRMSKQDAHGNLLLHCAVASGDMRCVRAVLDAGANAMLPNRNGCTALQAALDLVRLFLIKTALA
jgi:ankyrin repeat protein